MRLTDHLEKGSVFTLDEITAGKCYKKLSQLEDIEEELGIDLVTLSKLFKADNIYAYGHTEIQLCSNDGVSIYDKSIAIWNGVCVREYPLSEYGKSFALTKEELK